MLVRCLAPVAAALLQLGAGGCSNDLPAASFIDKLRVLAVRAEPPEISPGATTALDLLAVEPEVTQPDGAAPQPLTAVWLACALPSGTLTIEPCGVGGGLADAGALAPPLCADAPGAPLCIIKIGDAGAATPDLTASYTADADLLAGAGSTERLITVAVADTGAGALGCLLDLASSGGRPTNPDHCVISLKRLVISDLAQLTVDANANPTLADFSATSPSGLSEPLGDGNGVWLPAPGVDQAEWTLIADRSDGAAQKKADGTYEALTVSWFTTAGHLDGGRSLYLPPGCNDPAACADRLPETGASTRWFAPTADQADSVIDASRRVDFYAVIRDDRGGVGWSRGALTQP